MPTEQEPDVSIQELRADLPHDLVEQIANFILLLAMGKASAYYATALIRSAYIRGQLDGVREVKAFMDEQEPRA